MSKPKLETLEDVHRSLADLHRLTVERDAMVCRMEARIAEIRESFGDDLDEYRTDIEIEQKMLKQYLKCHKRDFDGPPRSIEFPEGTIGFRQSAPALKPRSKMTWKKVLDAIEAADDDRFLRVRVDVDREALMAHADDDTLANYGLRIARTDRAFIDLNREKEPANVR